MALLVLILAAFAAIAAAAVRPVTATASKATTTTCTANFMQPTRHICDVYGSLTAPAPIATFSTVPPDTQQPNYPPCAFYCHDTRGCESFSVENYHPPYCILYSKKINDQGVDYSSSTHHDRVLFDKACFTFSCEAVVYSFSKPFYLQVNGSGTPIDGRYAVVAEADNAPANFTARHKADASKFILDYTNGQLIHTADGRVANANSAQEGLYYNEMLKFNKVVQPYASGYFVDDQVECQFGMGEKRRVVVDCKDGDNYDYEVTVSGSILYLLAGDVICGENSSEVCVTVTGVEAK